MPFNTYTFLFFFIILLVVHYSLRSWQLQKVNLLAGSYLFYSAWNPLFVWLLLFSTISDWLLSKLIFNTINLRTKKIYAALSIIVNLGLLGYFKYGTFLTENCVSLFKLLGINFSPAPLSILLPVGISFYTFQSLSYTIDVYRKKIKPSKSFIDFALYVSFFPQLVAGPIVRANDFLPQCQTPRKADKDQFGWGLSLITIGLFMKIIMADTIFAPVVNQVYENPNQFYFIETWVAVFSFSGQIFCDFAGYSTIAIGAALCLGFILPDNFNAPYASIGFRDFWNRWHISLSSWLKDYLYISLGGNRISPTRTNINLILTMLIGGLWHGASWLFVIWGGLHGVYILIEHHLINLTAIKLRNSHKSKILYIIATFFIVSVTWIFFRSTGIHTAINIFNNLFHLSMLRNPILTNSELVYAFGASLLLLSWHIYRKDSSLEYFFSILPPVFRGVILFSMITVIFLFASGDNRAFIYFQF